ncbi:MAG: choice-of-anchor Q domain-containing protein [Kiritimatiellae bacterium]|nr:choice-of-anchor Q domain-containing protein [Kiritimatiellia bacterium]
MIIQRSIFVAGCALFLAAPMWASTYYADCNRPDDGGDGKSWAAAKQTIQAAVDLAVASDLVLVTNGIYDKGGKAVTPGSTLTNRVYSPLAITIRAMSTNPADTVIVGAPDPNTGGCGPAAIRGYKGITYGGSYLVGFTITNGYTFESGGTPYLDQCGGGAHGGTLSNCDIVGNTAKDSGGGRAYGPSYNSILRNNIATNGGGAAISSTCYDSVIRNNTAPGVGGGLYQTYAFNSEIVNNSASAGGGVSVYCLLSNCVIRGNSAISLTTSSGGAAGTASATWHKFYNCLIAENVSSRAGAIFQRSGSESSGYIGTLINCTVISNWSLVSGYPGGLDGRNGQTGPYAVSNCIIRFNYNTADGVENNYRFTANSAVAYSCLAPDVAGQPYDMGGNISADPAMVGTGDYQTRYQLQGRSPCVNAGTNLLRDASYKDLRGMPRIRYGTVDMGAYECIYRGVIVTFK